jgi:hypothetical protein
VEKWLTLQTLIAFALGVVLSAMVKQLLSAVRGHASSAAGG